MNQGESEQKENDQSRSNNQQLTIASEQTNQQNQQQETTVQIQENSKDDNLKKGLCYLITFAYFTASGGCFGLEPAIYSAGPAVALIFIFILPLLATLPFSLIASEMCGLYPEEGSTILWCDDIYQLAKTYSGSKSKIILAWCFSQFNTNTLFLKAYLNTAVYASLCFNYISSWAPVLMTNIGYKVAIGLGLNLFAGILTLNQVKIGGIVQILFSILTLTPVIITAICSLLDAHPENLNFNRSFNEIDWQVLFSTIIWNTTGLDQVTNISSQIKNPEKTYPKALVITTILVVISYVFPCLCFCLATDDMDAWNQGFVSVADQIPAGQQGHWLKIIMFIAGTVAVFALLNNQITCSIRELHKSGEHGRIPLLSYLYNDKYSCKKKVPKRYQSIPLFALFSMVTISTLLLFFSHDVIVSLDGYFIAFAALTQIIAYIYCRHGQYSMRVQHEQLQEIQGDTKQNDKNISQGKCKWYKTFFTAIFPIIANGFGVITGGWMYLLIFIGIQIIMFVLQIIYLAATHQLDTIVGQEQQEIWEDQIPQEQQQQKEQEGESTKESQENTDIGSEDDQENQLIEQNSYNQENQNQEQKQKLDQSIELSTGFIQTEHLETSLV